MGSGASKSAAQSSVRKFPNRAPGAALPPSSGTSASLRAAGEQATDRTRAARTASDRASAVGRDIAFEEPALGPRGARGSPMASTSKDQAIREDGQDPQRISPDNMIQPDLAKRLREIGVVQPNPTYSHSSTASNIPSSSSVSHSGGHMFPAASQNAVLSALEVRRRVQEEAEQEFDNLGRSSNEGRRFLPAGMIRDVLVMRERGASEAQIENRFNLKKGVVQRLGPPELYRPAGGG